ncbi:heme o synthase [Halobacillus seohaensis]|uniref:Protoheme IX farnesyltransferase n=1 Tax=Halobacillus seohaensis TaxID=447421 RepID=A0ABW2EQ55_9BACI
MEKSLQVNTNADSSPNTFSDFKSLFKVIVLVSNVLPVFTGFWLSLFYMEASFKEYWGVFVLTIIGSTLIMAGALLLNNWYDSDIDAVMERTKLRPTVTGNISLRLVFMMGIALSILGLIILLFTTVEAAIYAAVGWFTYVVLYTMWSKRRYTVNTMIGSVSGAVTPLIGWASIQSAFHIVPIVLFVILFIWQIPHTYAIAIKKHDEYKAAKVAMVPVICGFEYTKRQMLVYIVCLIPLPLLIPSLGWEFFTIATLLSIGWLMLAIKGFFVNDDLKWAHWMFLYSINYLMILFATMIIVVF